MKFTLRTNRSGTVKFGFFILGILILTLGVAFTIEAGLGTSPFDAVLVGLSEQVGLTVGSWEIVIALIMIGCNALLSRQKPEFAGLITALITGIGIDLWLFVLHGWLQPEQWFSKLVCFGLGLVIIGAGTAIYLQTRLAPIPVDRSMLILQELTGMRIIVAKTLIYLLFLILALIFKGPVSIGTLLTVCLGGPVLSYWIPVVRKPPPNQTDKSPIHHP